MAVKPRAVFISGSHRRHTYYFWRIAPYVDLQGVIVQGREEMIPPPPDGLNEGDKRNWIEHFDTRDAVEGLYFMDAEMPRVDIEVDDVNADAVRWFVKNKEPELVLIFGCGMISDETRYTFPEDAINLHLGLSPRYRGAATLFWPFYFLEPNYAGTTFHRIVSEPDAGKILHQSRPELRHRDGVHDVAVRAVVRATQDMARLLPRYKDWRWKRQKSTGKNFLARDFQPQHLRMIYDVFDNQIVDEYLRGRLSPQEPVLYQENLK